MRKKSFTLLEITVATAVFAIAICALLATISVNFRVQRANKETLNAVNQANAKMAEFLSDNLLFQRINAGIYPIDNGVSPLLSAEIAEQFVVPDGFALQAPDIGNDGTLDPHGIVLLQNPDASIPDIKFVEIIVVVRWQGVDGFRQIAVHSQRFKTFADEQAEGGP